MSKLILHTNFQAARDQLKRALERPERGRFIFVVGPSGSGKTTMRRIILRELVGKPSLWGGGRLPVIEVFALLEQNAYFSSRGLVEGLVEQCFVPDIRWLHNDRGPYDASVIQIDREIENAKAIWENGYRSNEPERRRWQTLQQLMEARHIWLACIDQAAALCTNHRNTDPADHILNLMSVIERQNINILLSGVHGTAALWAERPEVRRRSDIIWVCPYTDRRKEDRDPFISLLQSLAQRFTLSKPNLLLEMVHDLMAASAGIYGVLEKILTDASAKATGEGRAALIKRDIEASFYGNRDLNKLWDDVHLFEEAKRSDMVGNRAEQVAKRWGISTPKRSRAKAPDVDAEIQVDAETQDGQEK